MLRFAGWASSVMILCYFNSLIFSGMRLDVIIIQYSLCLTLVLLVFAMDCPGRVGGYSIGLHSCVYIISIWEILTPSMSDHLSASSFVDGLKFCPYTLDCHRLPVDKPKS